MPPELAGVDGIDTLPGIELPPPVVVEVPPVVVEAPPAAVVEVPPVVVEVPPAAGGTAATVGTTKPPTISSYMRLIF